jgi:hypothetical protein
MHLIANLLGSRQGFRPIRLIHGLFLMMRISSMPKSRSARNGVNDANCPREFRKDYWKHTSKQPSWFVILGAVALLMSTAIVIFLPFGLAS